MELRVGKVPPEVLTRLVYPHLGASRPDVVLRAGLGVDCAAVEFDGSVCVATCDPITAAVEHLGRLAVHASCNDLATVGAQPIALLLVLLLHDQATTAELSGIMADAGAAAADLGVEIIGGHTEVTSGLRRTVAAVTAIGKARRETLVTPAGARPGHAVLLTKGAGIEGTAILAADFAERLRPLVGGELLASAQRFIEEISVVPDGRIAARAGATAMHDVTEGGVLTGAWELAEAAKVGIELWADAVPVRPETGAICAALDIDPLALIGSGAMLITASQPSEMVGALQDAGIPARQVGTITSRRRVLVRGGGTSELVPPARDELWRLLDELGS